MLSADADRYKGMQRYAEKCREMHDKFREMQKIA